MPMIRFFMFSIQYTYQHQLLSITLERKYQNFDVNIYVYIYTISTCISA